VDNRLVLAGAVPAALLALAADGLLGVLEWKMRVPGTTRS
jgi:osmoprotectant transport system permease protein